MFVTDVSCHPLTYSLLHTYLLITFVQMANIFGTASN